MSSDREVLHQCEVGYVHHGHQGGAHGNGHVKMSDLDKLAMLKSKAKQESGRFRCIDLLKMVVFVGVVCAFTIVFYKIACLEHDVDYLYDRVATLQIESTQRQSTDNDPRAEQPSRQQSYSDGFPSRSNWPNSMARDFARPRHPAYPSNHGDVPDHPTTKPKECNCTTETPKQRSRRSASGSGRQNERSRQIRDVSNDVGTQFHEYGQHFAQHLLPNQTNSTIRQGEVFTWKLQDDATPFLREAGLELVDHRYLRAPVSGLYFLYSQITFQDSLTRTVGQQLVAWGRCGNGAARILMGTSVTQQRQDEALGKNPRDSSYTGGVVYLSEGDHVGVRPELGVTKVLDVMQTDMNTFFGGFLVTRDTKAPPINELCP